METYQSLQNRVYTTNEVEENIPEICLKRFTIIIPAYNEEKRIMPVLEELCSFISSNKLSWEIIVAIDGDDGTENIVNSYSRTFPFVFSRKASGRSGMGGGIKRGILASTGEYLILMDGDGSSTLRSMMSSTELLNMYDIVNFNRYSDPENDIPIKRRLASRSFNLILRILYGIHVYDTQCGYKIMRRSAVIPLVGRLTVSNAFFLSALFIYAKNYGLTVVEMPIKYDHSDGSKFNVIMTSISYMVSVTAFKIRNSKLYDYIPEVVKKLYYRKLRYL